jgi:hypothetical protein
VSEVSSEVKEGTSIVIEEASKLIEGTSKVGEVPSEG